MYTLGTSQIRWIGQQLSLPILDNKLVGFVGDTAERTATDPAIGMNQYTVFFDITNAPTSVIIYSTVMVNGTWTWDVDNTVTITDPTVLLQLLRTASGWTNSIVAVQRGDTAGMDKALRYDGVLYFNKQTQMLYIFNGTTGTWMPSMPSSSVILLGTIGTIFGWASTLAVPVGFLRCDGSTHAIADYPLLFQQIGYTYGGSGIYFNVPMQDNAVIMAQT